jgi:hypothetical protein
VAQAVFEAGAWEGRPARQEFQRGWRAESRQTGYGCSGRTTPRRHPNPWCGAARNCPSE